MTNSRRDFLRLSAGAAALAVVPGAVLPKVVSVAGMTQLPEVFVSSVWIFGEPQFVQLDFYGQPLDTPSDTH